MGAICSKLRGDSFLGYLKQLNNNELSELQLNTSKKYELINDLFNRHKNINNVLEPEEFEIICTYIDPAFPSIKAQKLYEALEEVEIKGIYMTKSINIEKFSAFVIPLIKSKIEKELFIRKLEHRGIKAGLRQKKIDHLIKSVEDVVMDVNLIYKTD